MSSPDLKSSYGRKLTDFVNSYERRRTYGVIEASISVPVLAGSLLAMNYIDTNEISGLMSAAHIFTSSIACMTGILGSFDGIMTAYRSHLILKSAEKDITENNFKTRGFWLNRTVEAA